jgi:hypothetical protein
MDMIPLDCPSCGHKNDPVGVAQNELQYRCRNCGMVYYGPAEECADGLKSADLEEKEIEGSGDFDMDSPAV